MSIKTVDSSMIMKPLYSKQKETVDKMRTSLISYVDENGISAIKAIENITVMRIYHQLTRIVNYLELMDKLEAKLYESIDNAIDSSESSNPATWMALLTIQERLQKSMIESHKLLQPYLDIKEFGIVELTSQSSTHDDTTILMNPEERDNLRSKAQSVLLELQSDNDSKSEET